MPRTDRASRLIAASPAAIFRALLDPAALVEWLPPSNMTAQLHAFDKRAGYRMSLSHKDAATAGKTAANTDVVDVEFVEIVPGARIVQRVRFESPDPAFADPMTMTWTLTPIAGGTEVAIVAEDVPDAISRADHDTGMQSSLANLERYILTHAR